MKRRQRVALLARPAGGFRYLLRTAGTSSLNRPWRASSGTLAHTKTPRGDLLGVFDKTWRYLLSRSLGTTAPDAPRRCTKNCKCRVD